MSTSYELTACPVCGSGDAREIAGPGAIADETAELWLHHTRRMAPTTDMRRLTDRLVFSQAPPLRIAQCTRCTHLFRNPRERAAAAIYGEETVDAAALGELFDVQRTAFMTQVQRLAQIRDTVTSGLEVGSYVGAFLSAARAAGWRFHGVDVNPGAVGFAREMGLDVTLGTIEHMAAGNHDVVAFWNCFEQLDDPRAAARAARALLVEGGIMTVRVPNGAFWQALRARLGGPAGPVARSILAQNNLLSFPYRNGFTPQSLRTLLEDCEFSVVRTFDEFSLPVSGEGEAWWVPMESRAVRALAKPLRPFTGAPWMEVYARAV